MIVPYADKVSWSRGSSWICSAPSKGDAILNDPVPSVTHTCFKKADDIINK